MAKKIVLKDIQQGKVIARELASKIIADMEMYLDNDIKSEDDKEILGVQYPLGKTLTIEHFVQVVEERIEVYFSDFLDHEDLLLDEEVTS
jgi:helix-turn-helix protein